MELCNSKYENLKNFPLLKIGSGQLLHLFADFSMLHALTDPTIISCLIASYSANNETCQLSIILSNNVIKLNMAKWVALPCRHIVQKWTICRQTICRLAGKISVSAYIVRYQHKIQLLNIPFLVEWICAGLLYIL